MLVYNENNNNKQQQRTKIRKRWRKQKGKTLFDVMKGMK